MEQIGGVLVPQILKGDVEGFQQNSVVEQIVGAPAPQNWEPIGERVQNCFPEQIVGIPVPQLMEAVVEVTPQERVQNRTPELIVDVPVPQIVEECAQNRTPEQIVDVPVPQFMEAAVEKCVGEQIVNSPVPSSWRQPWRNASGSRSWIALGEDVEILRASPLEHVQNRVLCGLPCASEHGRLRWNYACCTTGARAVSFSGADCGRAGAPHQAGWFAYFSSKARGVHW